MSSCPRIVPKTSCNNQPPRTVPYKEYHFPNWYDRQKSDFQQSPFGFSNFRRSNTNPTTLNEGQLPQCRTDPATMPNNPEATQEILRSETNLFRDKYGDFGLYDDYRQEDDPACTTYDWAINKTINTNPLMLLFFSRKNVDHVLRLICKLVREFCPQYKISPEAQNKTELLTIFRSMYFSVPSNPLATGSELEEELCRLNRAVLDWVVPRMITNIQTYLGYVRDQSTRRQTIPRAENVSLAGTRTNIMRPLC